MKKITLALLCLFLVVAVKAQERRNCHSMNNLEYRQSLDPSLQQRMAEIETFTQRKIAEMQNLQSRVDGEIITIPVVVHVIYSNSQENISVAQIQSQLDVLNEDFRRTNSDANNKWSQAADTQIEFQLATIDPNGNTTTGITRKSSTRTSWGTNDAMKSSAQGGVDPWNTSEYLNMWICNIGGGILGYAQFPGGSASTDGVVMSPQYFGSSDKGSGFYLSAPFDKGRTTTHEVGHFLNLRHIWGDGACGADDFVSDTPASDAANYGCASGHVSCGSEDMVENYMDYSDDSCMNLFTVGQKNRMRAVLEPGGSRRSLALSDKFDGGTPPPPAGCTTVVNSFPYGEGFESGDGWTQVSGDDGNWVRRSGSTPSSNTGPSAANEGSFYLFLEASTNGSAGQIGSNGTAILESACFDLSGKSGATFSFKNHMYGSNVGSLKVQAQKEGESSWVDLWSDSGNKGNQWNSESINLSAYLGSKVKLRIVGTTGNGWSSDIAVDDLSVTTGGGSTPDTQAPTTPGNVSASNVTQTSATISWNASSDNVAVVGYDVYRGSTLVNSVTTTSVNVSGLTAATSYTYSVRAKDAAGNVSNAGSVSFTTQSNQVSYCSSNGNNSSYEWIDYVAFGGIVNSTGNNGGYADFTSQVGTVARGSSSQITISAGFSSSSYTEFWAVWIDFNQDGTFADSEKVVSGSSSSANNLTATVNVPASANLGATRMRVSMKYNAAQTACESFTYGEVEDYTVNITNGGVRNAYAATGARLGNERVADVMAYPNPATSFVQVKLNTRDYSNATYRVVNTLGQSVLSGKLDSGTLNVSALNQGLYILEVNDGQKLLTTKLVKK
ncbi:GEVED domain-containing protein [Tenacibaculum geojense]|uniref:GEVED domain-containing protein n=1 Tax=Tenacibaculum geojense TaxID=915352 RepID=A0ABW3JP29_9FLAO